MKYFIVLLALLSAPFCHMYGQEKDLTWALGGYAEFDHFTFLKKKDGLVNSRNQSKLLVDFTSRYKDQASLFSSVELRNDLSDPQRDRIYMKEFYADFFTRNIDFRVGKQIILWGKTDGFNPTGNVSPIDYSDILDTQEESIGIFAINMKYYYKTWEFQGILSPTFQETVFPHERARWQQDQPTSIEYNGAVVPVIYNWVPPIYPESDIRKPNFGIRVSRNLSRLDFSFSYFNGWNTIPYTYSVPEPVESGIDIRIYQKYFRHQVIGGDFSYLLGKTILKGEGALFFPGDIAIDNPYFQYVIGMERIFTNIIPNKDLFILLQWMHEIKANNIEYGATDFNHLFQKNIFGRIGLDLTPDINVALQVLYAIKYQEYYIRPEFNYNILDGVNFKVVADLLGGNKRKNGFFSGYEDNDRIQVKVRYNF